MAETWGKMFTWGTSHFGDALCTYNANSTKGSKIEFSADPFTEGMFAPDLYWKYKDGTPIGYVHRSCCLRPNGDFEIGHFAIDSAIVRKKVGTFFVKHLADVLHRGLGATALVFTNVKPGSAHAGFYAGLGAVAVLNAQGLQTWRWAFPAQPASPANDAIIKKLQSAKKAYDSQQAAIFAQRADDKAALLRKQADPSYDLIADEFGQTDYDEDDEEAGTR